MTTTTIITATKTAKATVWLLLLVCCYFTFLQSIYTSHSQPRIYTLMPHWSTSAESLVRTLQHNLHPSAVLHPQSLNLFNFVCCSKQYLGLIWNASLIMIIIIFPCQFTFRTYFWSGGDLFLRLFVRLMSIGWQWVWMAWLLLTEQIMRAMSFECTRTHSMRGLDVLNEMEECLSTNRLKMKGLFCRHARRGCQCVSAKTIRTK